jgi:hypothetical protein
MDRAARGWGHSTACVKADVEVRACQPVGTTALKPMGIFRNTLATTHNFLLLCAFQ